MAQPRGRRSIRARWLADSDVPFLARLKGLSTLDFGDGNGVGPAKITHEGLAKLAKVDLPYLETLTLGWCDPPSPKVYMLETGHQTRK